MVSQQLIDAIPVPAVLLFISAILLVAFEVGFRIGRWWQERTPEETEGPTGTLVGSIIALMAFLLAITTAMASDRFDARRGLVLEEANAIRATYLQAGYLPEPYGEESRALLREYVPLRVGASDLQRVEANSARAREIHDELWARAEVVAREQSNDVVALYVESLTETIDVYTSRVTADIYARVPETIVILLLVGTVLTLVMVGYSAGLTERRGLLSAVVLVVALAAVLTLVIDLDRPRDAFLPVSQHPLTELQQEIGPP